MKRIACLLAICGALAMAETAKAGGCGTTAAVVVQQQPAFLVQSTNSVFVPVQTGFVPVGGANVNIVENRRGLFGRRSSSVIQASAGGGANVNIVSGRGR